MTVTRRAIAMFSGGLDSCLAAYLVKAQGVEVTALYFQTPFNAPPRMEGVPDPVAKAAEQLGVKLIRRILSEDYIEMIRSPRHGYGRAMNPCIDCRIFFLKKTMEIMREKKADFIVTGEVPGQRPMSQRRGMIEIIDRESGCEGIVLRPLSAKLLPPTTPEEKKWVDREKLLDLSGRSRVRQMELAEKLGIKAYPTPAGGCLLTEPEYSRKLNDLIRHLSSITTRDIDLLKAGRHFRISENAKAIVGRNDGDNKKIMELAGENDLLLLPEGVPGPTVLVTGSADERDLNISAGIAARYVKKGTLPKMSFNLAEPAGGTIIRKIEVEPFGEEELEEYRI